MDFNSVAVSFLTQLLNDAANDRSITDEEYEAIRNFLDKKINEARSKELENISDEIERGD